jgi:hypothetical protein
MVTGVMNGIHVVPIGHIDIIGGIRHHRWHVLALHVKPGAHVFSLTHGAPCIPMPAWRHSVYRRFMAPPVCFTVQPRPTRQPLGVIGSQMSEHVWPKQMLPGTMQSASVAQ